MAVPNKFDDPFWVDLAAATERKLELPDGLLVNVLTKGERTNADRVSEAGAKTPFQIIPATRRAAIEKYGVDPYLSPENAAEVAGILLKESLERNDNNPALAVAEYHGGVNRENWGPRTKSYVKRVVGISPDNPAATAPRAPAQRQSTFQRAAQSAGLATQPQDSQIGNVLKAYQAGQMTPEEMQEFEADVNAGRVMLPRGATLGGTPAAPATTGNVLDAGIVDAYASGRMSDAEKRELEADLQSGLVQLPQGVRLGQSSAIGQIPGIPGAEQAMAAAPPRPADPGLVGQLVGAGETGLSMLTGATGGALGALGGTIGGLAGAIATGAIGTPQGARDVEEAAGRGMQALTYAPRTPAGQAQTQAVGEAMAAAIPVAGLTAELGAAGRGASAVARGARDAAAPAVARIQSLAPAVAERVQRTLSRNPDRTPTPGTQGSVGAAAVDIAEQRRQMAEGLPVPIELTEGQLTRDPMQMRFESEAMKQEVGGAIRERAAETNARFARNFDTIVDMTDAEARDAIGVGRAVEKPLRDQMARDKNEIRVKYKEAEKAGELAGPVRLDTLVEHLNESAPDAATAPILATARARALQLGIAADVDGQLVPLETTIKNAERMRQAVGRATDFEPTNVRQSAIIKGALDADTEAVAGPLYRDARRARENFAKRYEDRAIISDLVNRKRGSSDRQVALEDTFKHSILQGTREDLSYLRATLQRAGDEGKQAWKDLQGATVNWLKDEAFRNSATDMRGNTVMSPAALDKAVKALERGGKMDFVLGKKGAQLIRDVNELSKIALTSPPGYVNSSNTASVILAALAETGAGSLVGLPIPVISGARLLAKYSKDRKLRARIERSLNPQRSSATR